MYAVQSAIAARGSELRETELADRFVKPYEETRPMEAAAVLTLKLNGKTNQVCERGVSGDCFFSTHASQLCKPLSSECQCQCYSPALWTFYVGLALFCLCQCLPSAYIGIGSI